MFNELENVISDRSDKQFSMSRFFADAYEKGIVNSVRENPVEAATAAAGLALTAVGAAAAIRRGALSAAAGSVFKQEGRQIAVAEGQSLPLLGFNRLSHDGYNKVPFRVGQGRPPVVGELITEGAGAGYNRVPFRVGLEHPMSGANSSREALDSALKYSGNSGSDFVKAVVKSMHASGKTYAEIQNPGFTAAKLLTEGVNPGAAGARIVRPELPPMFNNHGQAGYNSVPFRGANLRLDQGPTLRRVEG